MSPPKTFQETDSEAQRTPCQPAVSNLRWPSRPDRVHPDEDDSRPKYAPKHGDTSATYWNLFGLEANIYDKNFVESLMGNTNSMVFLNTLFSAIVAAFIIEIYKTLSPSNSQPVVISQSSAIRINIVLFLSFFLSMVSAVACALIQQWCYEYLKFAYPRAAPHERGRVRTYLFQGLNVFPMRRFMYGTHALLHVSVILFFWAIGEYFYNVNRIFGLVIRYSLILSAVIYALLSISPLFFSNSPYNTPMTPLLRATFIMLRIIFRLPRWCPLWLRRESFSLTGLQYYKGVHFDTAHLLLIEAEKRAAKLEPCAMEWLFTENDFSDSDMDKFLESLPGYISSHHTEKDRLSQYLTADYVLTRIQGHFITCATSVELSEEASIARASSCVQALRLICENSREGVRNSPAQDKSQQLKEYIQNIITDLQTLCDVGDPTMALRASCIQSLAVHGLLCQLVLSFNKDSSHFPVSLIPLYNLFFPNKNTDAVRDPDPDEKKRIREKLLRDAPLANLTMLAKAVRNRECALPSSFSFCWKTFDILLTKFGTIHTDTSSDQRTLAQSDFDDLYKNTHKYVHDDEMGFRMIPLLEILDIVDRGRRLLMVFSGRPKYHSRATVTVVFGKEYLRNRDLLEAFAHSLPIFITTNSSTVCMDLMEKVVCRDNLWSNLQMILWITQKSINSTSDKFRVFECCCNVLDVAFSVLDDSQKVDWRAPEFGSLWQHFESFITHGFKGAFMGRAASFRIGIIKARFCKVLLTQFWDDITPQNVLSFRSQWDAASLAKLIFYLGLRHDNPDDATFWSSYFNGGHIGAEFTVKALEMVDKIGSDGPLSIFCQLGHLATSTIASRHSGLERKDVKKVLKLQDKLMEDKRLSLRGASDTVWEDLGRLREQVKDLCSATSGGTGDTENAANAGEDSEGVSLQHLLQRIDRVSQLRVTRSEGPISSGHSFSGGLPSPVSRRAEGSSSGDTLTTDTSEGEEGFKQSDVSSSQSIVEDTHRVGTNDAAPIFRPKGPPSAPATVRRSALIALANPIIGLLPLTKFDEG